MAKLSDVQKLVICNAHFTMRYFAWQDVPAGVRYAMEAAESAARKAAFKDAAEVCGQIADAMCDAEDCERAILALAEKEGV